MDFVHNAIEASRPKTAAALLSTIAAARPQMVARATEIARANPYIMQTVAIGLGAFVLYRAASFVAPRIAAGINSVVAAVHRATAAPIATTRVVEEAPAPVGGLRAVAG